MRKRVSEGVETRQVRLGMELGVSEMGKECWSGDRPFLEEGEECGVSSPVTGVRQPRRG